MHEKDMWWKIVIVGCLAAFGYAASYPLEEKIKFGIDLYGGYSLLYEIDDAGMSPGERAGLSERVMRVLRERVDPKGVYNLVWRPVGNNRLEIQMPRPGKEVQEVRKEIDHLQVQLQDTLIRRSDVLRVASQNTPGAIESAVRGVSARQALLASASKAFQDWQAAKQAFDQRAAQIEASNIKKEEIENAVKTAADQRPAALTALVKGIPSRQALLEEAARARDALAAAESAASASGGASPAASQPADVAAKREAYEAALKKVLDANVDPNNLKEGVTQDEVLRLEIAFDQAVAMVLETNLDVNRLQTLLEIRKGEKFREDGLTELKSKQPSLAGVIDALVEAREKLNRKSRGEGRLDDPADLQRLLRGAGVLEFRILADPSGDPIRMDTYREAIKANGPRLPSGETEYQWFAIENPLDFLRIKNLDRDFESSKKGLSVVAERFGDKYFVLSRIGPDYELTHQPGAPEWSLKGSRPTTDQRGRPAIGFQLDERGGAQFANLTSLNKEKLLCIFLDDLGVSFATIKNAIRTDGIIEGEFSREHVNEMVKKLNAGSLPRKLKDPPISVRSIGSTLGEANRNAGYKAAMYGGLLVALFMLIYYFYAGTVAVVAVALNILLTAAMMSVLGATLTLAGLAGLVLAIGMGVDANVLINERMREELGRGAAMRMAIRLGYEKAFRAILDSHVTTILTCVILYVIGSEEIKGFGLTLGIGVIINIFTAYFVTRIFFDAMSLVSVPREVQRYPFYTAAGIAAFGALLYGLGYWKSTEETRELSVLIAFGKAIMYCGPAIVVLFILLMTGRAVHARFQRGAKSRMPMLKMIGVPSIDWIGLRPYFLGVSAIITAAGLFMFARMNKYDLYDIEFLGGTSAQVDLKPGSELANLPTVEARRDAIEQRLVRSGETLSKYGQAMKSASVSVSADSTGSFVVKTPGVPADALEPLIRETMGGQLSEVDGVRYSDPAAQQVTIRFKEDLGIDLAGAQERVAALSERFRQAADAISGAQPQPVQAMSAGQDTGLSFAIVTRETNKDAVVSAIMENLQGDLDIQPELSFKPARNPEDENRSYFKVASSNAKELGIGLSDAQAGTIDLVGWQGGVAIVLEDIKPAQDLETLRGRLRAMRLQPDFEGHGWRQSEVFGLDAAQGATNRFERVMIVVSDENYPLQDEKGGVSSAWRTELAEPEVKLIEAALRRQASLSQVTQFSKQVSGETQVEAYIALVLSWLMIIVYLWFRFGNVRWGVAAVLALVHDVVVAAGFVALTYYIAGTPIGKLFLIHENFRIDLNLVAAFLTVIGYSVNDTIVIFDRIRENKGRQAELTAGMINHAISQTLGRTLLTGLTALLTMITMYVWGGRGIHGFNFVLIIGVLTGTYSSFAIASQFLIRRKALVAA